MFALIQATRLLAPFLPPPGTAFPPGAICGCWPAWARRRPLRVRKAYVTLALAVSLATLGEPGSRLALMPP